MAEVPMGGSVIPRNEWILYKNLSEQAASYHLRQPSFGDYAINHPQVPDIDMRLVRPSANIRYAIDDAWFIVKGPNVRDNGLQQFRTLCNQIVSSDYYIDRNFSAGDEYIAECADGHAKTGNLTTWRWVGTNHHVQKVIADLATLDVA